MKATEISHIYVHVPFCARRCVYCDFAVTVARNPAGERWAQAIARELATLCDSGRITLADELDSVYIGGGTPSLLAPRHIARFCRTIGQERISGSTEWSVEANPESFSRAGVKEWIAAGVNRISFGVQSFDSGALRWMGRLHSPEDAATAISIAKAEGIDNLSLDLIFGLPDVVSRDWNSDLEQALALNVPHISLYGLTVEKDTFLFRQIMDDQVEYPSDRRYKDEYLLAAESLTAAGYEHYELSNFARPGFASIHNRSYWNGSPYLGLGNGAHSFYGGIRSWNKRDWLTYATSVEETGLARKNSERLTIEQNSMEAIWLALRTSDGLELATLGDLPREMAQSWELLKQARVEGDRVRLTPVGWLVLDDLTLQMEAVIQTDLEASGD